MNKELGHIVTFDFVARMESRGVTGIEQTADKWNNIVDSVSKQYALKDYKALFFFSTVRLSLVMDSW